MILINRTTVYVETLDKTLNVQTILLYSLGVDNYNAE